MSNATSGGFGRQLKTWRRQRKRSQLELALDASVSQRHLSWLETGRRQPSREMVLKLAEALDVPLRDRNDLLTSAGFAPYFQESALDEETMSPIYDALRTMLTHHEPLPSFVVNRDWDLLMTNSAAD
ncbi:MAG: helix-turn-helix domain-containing protein, partial [Pseudomonadota bacterium]